MGDVKTKSAHLSGNNTDATQAPHEEPPPTTAQEVLARACRGDRSVAPVLEQVLDLNPSLWQKNASLVAVTERVLVGKVAGTNLLLSRSICRQLERLKSDLAGPSPSPLEMILIDRIAACWLAVNEADQTGTIKMDTVKVAELQLKRMESANKRFLAAVKALAVVRRLTNGLKIEINHTHDTGAPAARSKAVSC